MKDPQGIQWAKSLSAALKAWCFNHSLTGRDLCRMIGITSPSFWAHLFYVGDSITPDTRVYARLYLLTSVDEANPCFVPSGQSGPRSWTEDEWTNWLTTDDAKNIQAVKASMLSSTKPITEDPLVTQQISELASILEKQFYVDQKTRENFLRLYGRVLGKLDKFLNTLMLPPEERELSIRMTVDSEN